MRGGNRHWKPPANMQFFIWPHYRLIVDGIHVRIRRRHAEILLFLMAHKDRRFSMREIAREIYRDMENGGPLYDNNICVQVTQLKGLFHAAGFALDLKCNGAFQGYAFHDGSITALPETRAEVERRQAAIAELPKDARLDEVGDRSAAAVDKALRVSRKIAKAAAKRMAVPRNPVPKPVEVHAFIDRFAETSGWVFPQRVEEHAWRRRR